MPASSPDSCSSARRLAVGLLYVELGLVSRPQMFAALVECARLRCSLPAALQQLGYL